MNDYIKQGHMKPVQNFDTAKNLIPHRGVFKSRGDTAKLRVVFDASFKTSLGLSLNDVLFTGPKNAEFVIRCCYVILAL